MSEKKPQQTWTPGQYLAAAVIVALGTVVLGATLGPDSGTYVIGFGAAIVLGVIGIVGVGTAAGRRKD